MRRALIAFATGFVALVLTALAGAGQLPAAQAASVGTDLGVGGRLNPGDRLQSGGYQFVMQTDGNLVLYGPSGAIWASYTSSPNAYLVNQSDGNVVIYAAAGGAVWASRTNNKGAGRLTLQGDGNVVQYNTGSGQATWTTYTAGGVSKMRVTGAIAYARKQIGKPYAWGGTGPNSFDCSGLTQAAYGSVAVALNRTTQQQVRQGVAVTRAALQPGDLVFYNSSSHVAIYVGNNEVLQALKTGTTIGYWNITYAGTPNAYRRVG